MKDFYPLFGPNGNVSYGKFSDPQQGRSYRIQHTFPNFLSIYVYGEQLLAELDFDMRDARALYQVLKSHLGGARGISFHRCHRVDMVFRTRTDGDLLRFRAERQATGDFLCDLTINLAGVSELLQAVHLYLSCGGNPQNPEARDTEGRATP